MAAVMFAGECPLCSVSDFVLFRLHSLSELNNNKRVYHWTDEQPPFMICEKR
jgi:hypothetical protein